MIPILLVSSFVESMEVLGSVSSIIAVVQVAGSIAKLCGGYILDVKDARQDVERLQQKATSLRDVLHEISDSSPGHGLKRHHLSANVLESANQCSKDLRKLQDKLEPKTRHKAMSKFGVRALKWPLSKHAVNEEVKMIEGYLTVFSAALQLDHMYVSDHLTLTRK
jgi:hypothetical protein